jgi:hypothetical protein
MINDNKKPTCPHREISENRLKPLYCGFRNLDLLFVDLMGKEMQSQSQGGHHQQNIAVPY